MANPTNEEECHRQYAMQLASASVLPMVLKAAIELGVLEIIERAGPGAKLSPSQIASQLPTQNNPGAPFMLDRILSLLTSHSILTCSLPTNNNQDDQFPRLYGLAPVAKYFIQRQDGGSLSPFLFMIHDKVIIDMWYHLKDAVLEGGIPFTKAHGINSMDFVRNDARFRELFSNTARAYDPLFMERILEIYEGFEGLRSLVDVGGGNGSILNMIVSKHPAIKGINYDLAPVIEKAPSYPGIEHVAGDMFVSVPKGDAIFMRCIIHGWDDEQCLKLLKNCYEAIPSHGKVIVVEVIVPEIPETSAADKSLMQFCLHMTTMNPRGQERTEKEFDGLAKKAGFSHIRVACCAYTFSVIEFIKKM